MNTSLNLIYAHASARESIKVSYSKVLGGSCTCCMIEIFTFAPEESMAPP